MVIVPAIARNVGNNLIFYDFLLTIEVCIPIK